MKMYAKAFYYLLFFPIRLTYSAPTPPPAGDSITVNPEQNVKKATSALVPDLAIIGLGMIGLFPLKQNLKVLNSLPIARAEKSQRWMSMLGTQFRCKAYHDSAEPSRSYV
jgi:hypothetical protein